MWLAEQFLSVSPPPAGNQCQKCGTSIGNWRKLCETCKLRPCALCGAMFFDRHLTQRFCTRKCSAQGQRRYRPPVCTTPYSEKESPAVRSDLTMTVSPAASDMPALGEPAPQSKGPVVSTCWS